MVRVHTAQTRLFRAKGYQIHVCPLYTFRTYGTIKSGRKTRFYPQIVPDGTARRRAKRTERAFIPYQAHNGHANISSNEEARACPGGTRRG